MLEEFKQMINIQIGNIEKKDERWSAMLANLKSDRLTQENENYRQFIERTNFLHFF